MGLIKALVGATSTTFADQWKEYFYCDSLDKDTLIVKGKKVISDKSSNTKSSNNIISSGSGIAVADGQCMIIVEQGEIVEVCAEAGKYTFDKSTEPSIFVGSLGRSIIDTFKTIGKRFTYGGDVGNDQRVYYINTKEMGEILYGTPNPIPFRVVVSEELGYKLSVDIRCHGNFTYKITDPLLFYKNVSGNVENDYKSYEIDERLKGELLTALQPALAKISEQGIQYYEIPSHTMEVSNALNEVLSSTWKEKRGIEVFSFNINSLSIPQDQRNKITEWEETAMTTDMKTAASRLIAAQADAIKLAASNEAGAMTGFLGMGMAMNQTGTNAQNLFAMEQNNKENQSIKKDEIKTSENIWICENCNTKNNGKFCFECGNKKPQEEWKCESCLTINSGNFCSECGKKRN